MTHSQVVLVAVTMLGCNGCAFMLNGIAGETIRVGVVTGTGVVWAQLDHRGDEGRCDHCV